MMNYEPLYVAFLVYFNRDQDYFECHEVLEELWLKKDRDPRYKGLLQVAVGLYHFRNGNIRGGYKMLSSAAERLIPYAEDELGIRLGKLVGQVQDYAGRLADYEAHPFPYADLTIEIWDPKLRLAVEQAGAEIKPNIPQRRKPTRGKNNETK
ncbi:hypothetical protein CHH75_08815 [Paenibacillus sp. 7541]|uniref:DUF309 domain-containing protein n=2 Tax=Paenibacillus TaxID=44249 RepID=A0ABW9T0G5_9BACL|nr:DUF309 domain-containing protein [Paenibacillus campinasensis]PAK53905.1 hypothetical protein CHH75_08815 [Paenibacillus sp. 7541]